MTKHLEKIRDDGAQRQVDRLHMGVPIHASTLYKAGFTAACDTLLPLIEDLKEALEFYANGMAFGHDGKQVIELQRVQGMAHVVYAHDMPSEAKPAVKIGTAAREALSKIKQTIGD